MKILHLANCLAAKYDLDSHEFDRTIDATSTKISIEDQLKDFQELIEINSNNPSYLKELRAELEVVKNRFQK